MNVLKLTVLQIPCRKVYPKYYISLLFQVLYSDQVTVTRRPFDLSWLPPILSFQLTTGYDLSELNFDSELTVSSYSFFS